MSSSPFDKLSDDVLDSILARRLWNPFDVTARKGWERAHLGVVCKRFHQLVCSHRTLDWDLAGEKQTEQDLLRYMVANPTPNMSLTRFCLTWTAPNQGCLETCLSTLIPQVAATLEDFHLVICMDTCFYGSIDRRTDVNYNFTIKVLCLDWDKIFMLLQKCKKLQSTGLCLWRSKTTRGNITLKFAKPFEPFPQLRSLSLYGFTVPPRMEDTFLSLFPLLENLEIHHHSNSALAGFDLYPLQKVFVWGNDSVRLDIMNPEEVHVPKSMDRLLRLLLSLLANTDSDKDFYLLKKLDYLMEKVAARRVVVNALGGVPGLTRYFKMGSKWQKEFVLKLLMTALEDEEVCLLFSRTPENLATLFKYLDSGSSSAKALIVGFFDNISRGCDTWETVKNLPGVEAKFLEVATNCETLAPKAMDVFVSFMEDTHSLRLIGSDPEALQRLVKLLRDPAKSEYTSAAAAIGKLAAFSKEVHSRVATVPGIFDSLVEVNSISWPAQTSVEDALVVLLEGLESLKGVTANVTWCVTKLAKVLLDREDHTYAASCMLHRLALEDSLAKEVANTPLCLRTLALLLSHSDSGFRIRAAWALHHLTQYADILDRLLAKVPRVVSRAVLLLQSNESTGDLQKGALALLGRFASRAEGRKLMAKVPGCVESLVDLLQSDDIGVQESAAEVLSRLAADPEFRTEVAKLPGISQVSLGFPWSASGTLETNAVLGAAMGDSQGRAEGCSSGGERTELWRWLAWVRSVADGLIEGMAI